MALSIAQSSMAGDANLQGYYKFDGDFTDSSSNSYNMTGVNSPTSVAGVFGNAYTFNGTDQYAYITGSSAPNLKTTGSKSVSAWVTPGTSYGSGAIFSTEDTVINGFLMYLDGGDSKAHFIVRGASPVQVISTQTLSAGVTYHVVGVHDVTAGELRVYVNTAETKLSYTGSNTATAGDISIGARDKGASTDLYFKGTIDDTGVFDRAITTSEISELYSGVSFIPQIIGIL